MERLDLVLAKRLIGSSRHQLNAGMQACAVAEIERSREAMGRFCDRVERGEIRSRRTYAEFCEILGREPKQ